ncbi:hypothetical protein [Rhodococcus tukisamuensis]|uniref:DUF2029 domain-containing protein n=1 Tax=Rhodococcus tukisamuensis TaxID=168276 RepID=A0A1G7B0K4_9NOCA|nr:hypothetical protein [Rhodococcus tukisamuensis]SDE20648.1 hypothetical protein SAMN05444580_11219 [Rhodococcus tukisamuensis]
MSAFERAMRSVGDLDDEFYLDERQRDVWNEAAAVGFQLFLWAALAAAAVLPWVAGRTGAWIGLGLLVAAAVISIATIEFARRRHVDLHATAFRVRPRLFLAGALYAVGVVGLIDRLVVAGAQDGASTWSGAAVGAAVGIAGAALVVRAKQRRQARFEAAEDLV